MKKTARLATLGGRLAIADTRSARPASAEVKEADPYYLTPEHRAWRELVISRAHRRCEAIENGSRCWRREPAHRMFADHIVELSDDGAPLDPANGKCLCGRHHTLKTNAAKLARQTVHVPPRG